MNNGIYRGVVTQTADPENLFRIKAIVPQLFGQSETDWCWPVAPNIGGLTTPAISAPVWISFEGGDESKPLWMGTWQTLTTGPLNLPAPGGGVSYGNVTTQTTFGLSSGSGTATTVSRSDHIHGTPTHTSTDHAVGTVIPVGAPGNSAIGDTAASGAASTLARADHVHGRESAGTPGASAPGDVAAAGSALTVARSDHKHGREVGATPGTSNPGDTASTGVATTVALSDHRHAREAKVQFLAVFSTPGSLSVSTGVGRFRFPFSATIVGTTAAVNTAPTGASLIADVLKNNSTIYTTTGNRPTIAAGANATSSEPTPDVTAIASGDFLTVNIAQVGSTVAGADLTVFVGYTTP